MYIYYIQTFSAFIGAFFAFCFFIIGQKWISNRAERKRIISELGRLHEYIVMQVYFFETNISTYQNISKNNESISIHLTKFIYFPIEDDIYKKIGNYTVFRSIVTFIINLRVLNKDIQMINSWIKEISEFSRIAMIENRQEDFEKTIEENFNKLKSESDKIYSLIKSTKEKIDPLLAEIEFTRRIIEYFFLKRWYLYLRIRINPKYRECQIKKILEKNNKEK
jgi:hypothetical protein